MRIPHAIRPQLRPLRPPLQCESAVRARFFTRNTQLLHLAPGLPRPQLGYLGNASRRGPNRVGQWHLSRLITTEHKRFLKEQAWMGGRWTFYWTIITSFGMAWAFLFTHELAEREFPTPPDWSYVSNFKYHSARGLEEPEAHRHNVTEWGIPANAYRKLLSRLEDPEIDGAGLVQQTDGGLPAPGEGPTGFDVSSKSETWRRGYYQALMGQTKCAEHLDGKVEDMSRRHVFPKEYMIGPSNPNPKPCPPWRYSAPLEENCVPAEKPPEDYYHKILTTKGFTRKERFDAALAYGDWLDYKEKHTDAEDMFRFALNLATEDLANPSASIDFRSATIKADAPMVTDNLLAASTALAIHHAQMANTSAALPIFLSVLRARRTAPFGTLKPDTPKSIAKKERPQTDIGVFKSHMESIWSLLQAAKYPEPPPSGDEAVVRTPDSACEEAGLMAYVGEILFSASNSSRDAGWSWTKDALDLAEQTTQSPLVGPEGRKKCIKCIGVAYGNMQLMLEKMKLEAAVDSKEMADGSPRTWKSFVGLGGRREADLKEDEEKLEVKEQEFTSWQTKIRRSRILEAPETTKPLWSWGIMAF